MGYRWGRVRNEEIARQLSSGNVNLNNIKMPGHGPFSNLPPPERPGWQSGGGRGHCWYYIYNLLKKKQ